MERNIQRVGLLNLVVLAVLALSGLLLGRFVHSLAAQVAMVFLGLGVLVAVVSYFQMRLAERERFEKLEFDELVRAKGGSALFNAAESEVFPVRRSREQFERFMVPVFSVLLLGLQAAGAFFIWRWLRGVNPVPLHQPMLGLALFGIAALVCFLLGKYSAGVARFEAQRLLQPGASYLLLSAYLFFVALAGIAAVEAGFPKVDLYLAQALAVVLALIGVENLINLVFEVYRPRLKGQQARLLYDSRLVGLLSQPEGLVTTVAQALDYQFGFKVSETWFYRFLENALAWLILLQVGILLLSTCFCFIEPGEEGLLERFGRPVASRPVLQPGAHLKFPWPVDRVARFRTRQVQSFTIGIVPDPEKEREKTVIWTVSHYKEEFNLLVASRDEEPAGNGAAGRAGDQAVPVSLLSASVPVHFQVRDVRQWAYNQEDAAQLLEKIATREIVRYLVGVDLNEIMSSGRQKAAELLRQRIQQRADELELGAEVLFVGLQDIHPPVKVADAYEAVVGAIQDRESKKLAAEGYQAKEVPIARARAEQALREAEAYRSRKAPTSQALANRFANQVAAHAASPTVFTLRAYLETLERASTNARKYVLLSTNTEEVILLDLQDKVRPELLDIQLPAKK